MGAQAVSYGVAEEDASWYIEPRFPKTPHPVPLPIRWGEGGLQVG